MAPVAGTRVVGYLRVSTAEQSDSGAGIEAQRAAITAEAERRGWQLIAVVADEGASGSSVKHRPALDAAIGLCETGGADALCVAKLDRLSRSLPDFGVMLERSRSKGWALVALDLGVDTTTPAGELVANVMMSVAQWERRVISQRTKDGLAAKKSMGVQLGRPSKLDPRTARRIRKHRDAGLSLRQIAERLNDDAIPTGQGGARWYASTVRNVLERA